MPTHSVLFLYFQLQIMSQKFCMLKAASSVVMECVTAVQSCDWPDADLWRPFNSTAVKALISTAVNDTASSPGWIYLPPANKWDTGSSGGRSEQQIPYLS